MAVIGFALVGVMSESPKNLYFPLFPRESFGFRASYRNCSLEIIKLVRTKDLFGHFNVESSYLCLLVSLPSRVYTPTVPSHIYNPSVLICSYVPPIFACMFV